MAKSDRAVLLDPRTSPVAEREFSSIEDLVAKIVGFIEHYNRTAKPFKWTYEGKPLKVA